MSRFVSKFCIKTFFAIIILIIGSNKSYAQCKFEEKAERCVDAIFICGNVLNGYKGILPVKNSTDSIWDGSSPNTKICGGDGRFDNTVWFSFIPCSKLVHLRIKVTNCVHPTNNIADTGIQLGMYIKCRSDQSVNCAQFFGATSGVLDLVYNDFEPGEIATIVLDGYAGSICEFEIEVIAGIDVTPVSKPLSDTMELGYVTGQKTIQCTDQNKEISYNLTRPECQINFTNACTSTNPSGPTPVDSICYVWQVKPYTGRYFANKDSIGLDNNLVFTAPGIYTISVDAFFHPAYGGKCDNAACGDIISWTVEVLKPDTTIAPIINICSGQSYNYCGQSITSDTTISCQLTDCTLEIQTFKFGTSKVNNLGTQYICYGQSFDFQGVSYSEPNDYQVVDINDCNSTIQFKLETISINTSLNASIDELNCLNKKSTLAIIASSNGSNGLTYDWQNSQGTPIGNLSNVTVNLPDTYTVIVSYPLGNGKFCTSNENITVTQDIKKPLITAFVPALRCTIPNEVPKVLTLTSNLTLTSSEWKIPNGNLLQGMNIIVDSLNAILGLPYEFHGVATNGCVVDTSFLIKTNFQKAKVTVDGQMLTCTNPQTTLELNTDIDIDVSTIKWSVNTGTGPLFICCDGNKIIMNQNVPGIYAAKVRATDSQCYSEGSKIIVEDKLFPIIDLNESLKWYCNTKELTIAPVNVDQGSTISYNWSTSNNGSIVSVPTAKSITVSAPGMYQLTVKNSTNGCSEADSIRIIAETNVPNAIQWTSENISCFGENDGEINILNSTGGFGPFTYTFSGNDISPNVIENNLKPGKYDIEVSDIHDCKYLATAEIFEPPLLTVDAEDEFVLEYLESIDIDFVSTYNISEIKDIVWVDSKGKILGTNPTLAYTGNVSDLVELVITNNNGCEARTKINIIVDNELKIYFPNVFSPNGDGINDRLNIFKNKISATPTSVHIYDRFGNMVFQQSSFEFGDNETGWDGRFNGQTVENGVYVLKFIYSDLFGQTHTMLNTITVLK